MAREVDKSLLAANATHFESILCRFANYSLPLKLITRTVCGRKSGGIVRESSFQVSVAHTSYMKWEVMPFSD